MAVTVTPRSRVIAAAAAALVVPALAGCATNFGAQTDQQYDAARGTNDRSGDVDVLNALVVSAEEGSGTVIATLVNNNRDVDDKLVGITVDGTAATISGAGDATELAPLGHSNLAESGAVTVVDDNVAAGNFVELVFSFEHGKAITINAPVVPHEGDYEDVPQKGDK